MIQVLKTFIFVDSDHVLFDKISNVYPLKCVFEADDFIIVKSYEFHCRIFPVPQRCNWCRLSLEGTLPPALQSADSLSLLSSESENSALPS